MNPLLTPEGRRVTPSETRAAVDGMHAAVAATTARLDPLFARARAAAQANVAANERLAYEARRQSGEMPAVVPPVRTGPRPAAAPPAGDLTGRFAVLREQADPKRRP